MEPWLNALYDAEAMRAVDRWAIDERGIAETELIEAAGTALAEAVAELAPDGPARLFCGKGNNGGDGLVAARHLSGMGYEVEALRLFSEELPGDLDAWLEARERLSMRFSAPVSPGRRASRPARRSRP